MAHTNTHTKNTSAAKTSIVDNDNDYVEDDDEKDVQVNGKPYEKSIRLEII